MYIEVRPPCVKKIQGVVMLTVIAGGVLAIRLSLLGQTHTESSL
jgi:hypothetical protein